MPVYFEVAGREFSLTDDEARELAAQLQPETPLRNAIMLRVGVNESSPVRVDVGGDERANLVALTEAIDALEQENELSPAVRMLRRSVGLALAPGDGD
jgi:hypothetical protein